MWLTEYYFFFLIEHIIKHKTSVFLKMKFYKVVLYCTLTAGLFMVNACATLNAFTKSVASTFAINIACSLIKGINK